jgi:hypothetical protein
LEFAEPHHIDVLPKKRDVLGGMLHNLIESVQATSDTDQVPLRVACYPSPQPES